MMKFLLFLMFMILMINFKIKMSFMYNLSFILGFMMMFMYWNNEGEKISSGFMLNLESYSLLMVILSIWIVGLMIMSLDESKDLAKKNLMFFILLLILMVFFSVGDLMIFYLMFEMSLVPTFWMILYWGSNPERVSASYYLVVYMLVLSFPLLIYIFKFYFYCFSFKFFILESELKSFNLSFWGYMMIFGPMFVKMPMYLMHLWLPKAHVEAPVYGSMILAGILLKMGSFGLVRFLKMFIKISSFYSGFFVGLSILGGVYLSLVCLVQVDMKSLVAYSSVVHMNMMLGSLLTLSKMGLVGGFMMMVGHGLCSSGLFYLVGLSYKSSGSRLLMINKGMMNKVPILSFWWFLLCVINFSFPLSLNFFSEVLMLSVILNWDYFMMMFLMMICFFSSCYSLYLFSFTQHGESLSNFKLIYNLGLVKEFMVLIMHLYPLVFILMNLMMFL